MAQAGSLAVAHGTLLPRPPGGNGPGALLALLVHAGLLAALTVSVDWHVRSTEVVSAELWASVPQLAAPPPPAEPAPTPPPPQPAPVPVPVPVQAPPPRVAPPPAEPDIATQRAERRKAEAARKKAEIELEKEAERKRLAADKQKRAEDERKKRQQAALQAAQEARAAKLDNERLARQREENLRRMMGQAGGATTGTATGTAAQSAAPSTAYVGRLVALIRSNLVYTGSTAEDNNAAEVEVSAAANGSIIARRLVKSSGHKDWDEAVLRAIDRTARLPRDTDGRVPPQLIITFRPRE